jgi:hypothetical protein
LLFRFFDFTAEEGKTYQYRVALELENPNFELSEALLKDPKLREGKERFSAFSEATKPVTATLPAADVVAGPVKGESATLILLQRERAGGAFVAHIFGRLEAGQTLAFKVKDLKYEKPVGGVAEKPLAELDFQADALLVDLKGGGDRGWPGEVLLVDPSGRLALRSEIAPLKMPVVIDPDDPEAVPPTPTVRNPPPAYAAEYKRLEYTYNYEPPAETDASGSFNDLLSPGATRKSPMPRGP